MQPPFKIYTIFEQGTSKAGGALARELYDAGMDIAPSSFVEQRKRIGYLAFRQAFEQFNDLCNDSATLKGYKAEAADGTTVPLPRNPNSKNYYISESNPKGWNITHANIVYSVTGQVVSDCSFGEGEIDSRRARDEQGALYSLIYRRKFQQPTIVILDRGYESYSNIYHLSSINNLFYVLRVKNDGLRPVRELPLENLDFSDLKWTAARGQTKDSAEAIRFPCPQSGRCSRRRLHWRCSRPAPFAAPSPSR